MGSLKHLRSRILNVFYNFSFTHLLPRTASGLSHCPTTLIYLCFSDPATSLNSGRCIQQPGARPVS